MNEGCKICGGKDPRCLFDGTKKEISRMDKQETDYNNAFYYDKPMSDYARTHTFDPPRVAPAEGIDAALSAEMLLARKADMEAKIPLDEVQRRYVNRMEGRPAPIVYNRRKTDLTPTEAIGKRFDAGVAGSPLLEAAENLKKARAKHTSLRKALLEAQGVVGKLGEAIYGSLEKVQEAEKRLIQAAQ